ncbi:hypothetical protein KQI65_10545 [bacterium]|nr:hypothetical protein [bacterium]
MRFFLPLIFFLHTVTLTAGGPLVIERDLPGWIIGDPDFYNAGQLYGYINGGAELYREFGFRQVTAQRCSKADHEMQVDVYEMLSPRAAFGMFSVLRGTCTGTLVANARWSCVRPEQILFARGKYLISVIPYDRSKETRQAALKAAKALLKRAGGKDYRPNELFRSGPFSPGLEKLLYLHGPLALQSALPAWSEFLEGIERFDMEYARFGKTGRETTAAVMTFRSHRDMEQFLRQSGLQAATEASEWYVDRKSGRSVIVKGEKTLYYVSGHGAAGIRKRIK